MENQHDDSFFSLTPERVLEAVEQGGLSTRPVCYALNSFENRVYEVELEDSQRVIVKFYRPGRWTEEQILEEHQFMADLEAEEIPICPLRPFPDGRTLQDVGGIYFCLYERKGGRAPDELTTPLARRIGMLLGRLHNVGAKRPAEHRVRIGAETYVRDNLRWLEDHDTLPPALWKDYQALATQIADVCDQLTASAPVHRLHGDFHLGNLLLRDGLVHVLDFDDMVVGPAVQDIWLVLPGRDDWAMALREEIVEGYEQFRGFDRRQLAWIEAFRGLRLVHYSTWLARRWHDPIFPRTWPHFGTETYWTEQIEALEDVVASMEGAAAEAASSVGGPVTPVEEPELTNKDFFWDWEE
jgi:Ser/Thr protein kinase RdoA (MazF antagonist)